MFISQQNRPYKLNAKVMEHKNFKFDYDFMFANFLKTEAVVLRK